MHGDGARARVAVALSRCCTWAGWCSDAIPSHTWVPVETACARAVRHRHAVLPSIRHLHRLQLGMTRICSHHVGRWCVTNEATTQCDLAGAECRCLSTGHCGAAAFVSTIINQACCWPCERGLYYSSVRSSQAVADRVALEGLGRCSWSWGGGCPRNSLSLGPGSPWGAGASRDFYSISSWAILTTVCGPGS